MPGCGVASGLPPCRSDRQRRTRSWLSLTTGWPLARAAWIVSIAMLASKALNVARPVCWRLESPSRTWFIAIIADPILPGPTAPPRHYQPACARGESCAGSTVRPAYLCRSAWPMRRAGGLAPITRSVGGFSAAACLLYAPLIGSSPQLESVGPESTTRRDDARSDRPIAAGDSHLRRLEPA